MKGEKEGRRIRNGGRGSEGELASWLVIVAAALLMTRKFRRWRDHWNFKFSPCAGGGWLLRVPANPLRNRGAIAPATGSATSGKEPPFSGCCIPSDFCHGDVRAQAFPSNCDFLWRTIPCSELSTGLKLHLVHLSSWFHPLPRSLSVLSLPQALDPWTLPNGYPA